MDKKLVDLLNTLRSEDGFPDGKDTDIIKLSNPPYFTMCPNPYMEKFVLDNGKQYSEENDSYNREPFAADVSEGKNDPLYMAHSYHTKVPYKAIMRYILHYTDPGDIVLDGFSGTGMTGVAAQKCENIDMGISAEISNAKWGKRYAVLSDISPIAGYISHNYNNPFDLDRFTNEFETIVNEVEKKYGYLYKTRHVNSAQMEIVDSEGTINYVIWSDVFLCPECSREVVFWDEAVDLDNKQISNEFNCPHCHAIMKKGNCKRSVEQIIEKDGSIIEMSKQVPVRINYSFMGKRYEKNPGEEDLKKINEITYSNIPYWYPTERMCEGTEARRNDISGITNVHHFMTKRNLLIFSAIMNREDMNLSRIVFTSIMMNCTKTYRYRTNGKGGSISGTLYIPSLFQENNIFESARRKVSDFQKRRNIDSSIVGVSSTTKLLVPTNSIDYIFTDPPFGSNLNYSELSFIWESWLKVKTNVMKEAIINKAQKKTISSYHDLMEKCFSEYYRVLKPNRWITVEFHNSQNAVWNVIQESLQKVGFVVADVRILNKKQDSFKQIKAGGAVKEDLVISAYKPKESLKKGLSQDIGIKSVWQFVQQHLEKLPVVVVIDGKIEVVEERKSYLLFDRMVSFYLVNGLNIPLSANEFYMGLSERFLVRDEMFFLPEQVNEYDDARIKNSFEPIQFELFIHNEKSAIAWLYQQLTEPKTYSELQPKFMQETKSIDKYEKIPELNELLQENFLQNDEGKWYIPNSLKEGDMSKLREKNLLKEFNTYLQEKGKLKNFRIEAIRAGFAKLWTENKYEEIVMLSKKLPDSVIEEDDKLLMYFDLSEGRI